MTAQNIVRTALIDTTNRNRSICRRGPFPAPATSSRPSALYIPPIASHRQSSRDVLPEFTDVIFLDRRLFRGDPGSGQLHRSTRGKDIPGPYIVVDLRRLGVLRRQVVISGRCPCRF